MKQVDVRFTWNSCFRRIACAPTENMPQLGDQVSEQGGERVTGDLEDFQDAESVAKRPKTAKRKRLEQYFLDFGQKDTTCKRCDGCGFVYSVGLEDDEKMHVSFHKTYTLGVAFMVRAQSCAPCTPKLGIHVFGSARSRVGRKKGYSRRLTKGTVS